MKMSPRESKRYPEDDIEEEKDKMPPEEYTITLVRRGKDACEDKRYPKVVWDDRGQCYDVQGHAIPDGANFNIIAHGLAEIGKRNPKRKTISAKIRLQD